MPLVVNNTRYFYTINYTKFEESLCKMEMKYLFNIVSEAKHFYTDIYVDPSRSPYIKQCLTIMYNSSSLNDLVTQITNDNLFYEKFKVFYINNDNEDIGFHERRSIENTIGLNILGEAEMTSPEILLGVTNINGNWLLGKYEKNNSQWQSHNKKPNSYSNALNIKVSRAIVNIAVSNNLKCSVVDPCCGIGTILIEAISQGIHIKGYEINAFIGGNAKKNLDYFGYEDVITIADMNTITDKFDVAIVDLPYGLFSQVTLKQQLSIINKTRIIANRMIIITLEDMEQHILLAGFNIVDRCHVLKGTFKRYITICT